MAAAAVLLGLGVFALVGLESSKVMSASGALLPEEPAARELALRSPEPRATDDSKPPATEPATLRIQEPSTQQPGTQQPSTEPAKPEAAKPEAAKPEGAKLETAKLDSTKIDGIAVAPAAAQNASTPSSAAEASDTAGAEPANRDGTALTQASKERAQPTPKRAVRRPVVARRRAAAAPPPANAKSAANKIDCRQPYWIDEAGIRRLKLACL